ncbi:PstS family phosphate ABC transporter substrate-binding protein [Synechococcus sp. Edmonson 11F2]|uniref:PstS family phosphate ABC transporter substrate-binding protein n=1 Tax=Synechococcus sp. Edmonson 11F2 TaxID=2823733 RepID=UPI0020CD552C|nr:PstS family phosphate ABC transporter substrate-binding protein [Synechococcus sp. Edmonson 11F2]MCP9844815.1 PstS family phosphate ABC transporter substrate-binding protein [Synechococcus sp. Edmonson 11F2]
MFPSFLLPQASRLTCGGTSLAVALLITATPLSPTQAQTGQGVIRISGSSTVFPITQEAIRAFRKTAPGRNVRFELQETGTSAGFRDFCSGKVPIANASRPISSKELKACEAKGVKFIELPIAFDALTVAVHPKNTWASQITVKELNTLWNRQATGRVKRWKQVNSAWPDRPIKLCGAGSDSGTFDYFNKAITGDAENSRSDYTASEDDNVLVRCVANDPNALGYFGFDYYLANQNKLRSLAIVGRKGATRPSVEAVQKERYTPLSRPLFIYINNANMLSRPEVQKFVTFFVRRGPQIVKAADFIPLPDSTYLLVESKLYRHVLGTSFGGDLPIGLTIGQALDRSFDQLKQPRPR